MTMNETAINWTELTWNPASGCEKISAGCKYCYADQLAEQKRGTRAFPNGFELTVREHKLREPAREKRASLIFTSSMTDVFWLPTEYRDRVFDVIESTPHHRYQVLTKRADVAADYLSRRGCPANVWIGCTLEDTRVAWRLDAIRSIDARVRFVSAEPLIGDVSGLDFSGFHWLISGGESGLHLTRDSIREERGLVRRGGKGERGWMPREDRYSWITGLRDTCARYGVAFWHKQWGGPRPESGGRLVNGVEHNGMPTHIEGAMPAEYVHEQRAQKFLKAAHQVSLPVLG